MSDISRGRNLRKARRIGEHLKTLLRMQTYVSYPAILHSWDGY